MITLSDFISSLPPEEQAAIKHRTEELLAEELSLQQLRQALEITQTDLAGQLGVRQDTVSRMERQTDMLLSTLRNHVRAMGGELELVARFPDRPPVRINGLAPLTDRS